MNTLTTYTSHRSRVVEHLKFDIRSHHQELGPIQRTMRRSIRSPEPDSPTKARSTQVTPCRPKRRAIEVDSDDESSAGPTPSNRTQHRRKQLGSNPKLSYENDQDDADQSERPTMQRVKFDLMEDDDAQDDDSDDFNSDAGSGHLPGGTAKGNEPEGFLAARNASDAYFLAYGKSNPTSNNLFSARPNWKEPLPVSDFLESFDPKPLQSAESYWNQWTAELLEGYSLLFYGLGSKRSTLNEFVKQRLVGSLGWEGLVINGFQSGVDLSNLLNDLEDMVRGIGIEVDRETRLPIQRKASSLELIESRAQRLCALLTQKDSNLPTCVIMIHNLDGLAFRNQRIQTILGLLAAQPRIHLLATIDHIYAPVLLASHLASARSSANDGSDFIETFPSSYNFIYHHLPTYTPYTLESLLSGTVSTLLPANIFPTIMVGSQSLKSDISQNTATTPKAALHVLSSLTERAKSLFRLLACHQLSCYQSLPSAEAKHVDEMIKNYKHQEEKRAPRVALVATKLFESARSSFVASAESQMEALLVEFRDHGIILSSFGSMEDNPQADPDRDRLVEDDEEWLWIGLCQLDLEEVMSQLEDL